MKNTLTILIALLSFSAFFPVPAGAEAPGGMAVLMQELCVHCHGGEKPDAGLNLAQLKFDLSDPPDFVTWVRVHDKLAAGEMPPPDEAQPTPDERRAALGALRKTLHAASLAQQEAEGRVALRRLNRTQHENTLNGNAGGYRIYGNGFDTTPGFVSVDASGVGSAGGVGNFANYHGKADWNGIKGNVTTVGTNGGASYYGAFDMCGNVYEWTDFTGVAGSSRWFRGGGWVNTAGPVSSSARRPEENPVRRPHNPARESNSGGFRLASPVPKVHAENGFPPEIQTVLTQKCVECHNQSKHKADIDFTSIKSAQDLDQAHRWWPRVLEAVSEEEMPPEDETNLTKAEREQLIHWVANLIRIQQSKLVNDPGVIPLRRLTAAEYRYTLSDITRNVLRKTESTLDKSIDVTRYLPTDQSTTHSFPNDAHGQAFSTEHLAMYLQAGKHVAKHVHFLPYGGMTFASLMPSRKSQYIEHVRTLRPHIQGLAKKHGLSSKDGSAMFGRALFLCWKIKQQGTANNKQLQELCKAHNLNPKYLSRIQENLLAPTESPWVQQLIQEPWEQLTQSKVESDEKIQQRCQQIAQAAFATIDSLPNDNLVSVGFPKGYRFEIKELETNSQGFLASRQGDELVTRCYIALTDAGTGIQNAKVFWARKYKMFPKSTEFKDDEELHKQAIEKYQAKKHSEVIGNKRHEGVLLEVPGYYEFELREPFKDEPGSEKKRKAYFKFEGHFQRIVENAQGAVQVLFSGQPILNKQGTVLTKAPERFEIVPQTPEINKSIAHHRFLGPSTMSYRHLKWYDEMAIKFAPQLLPVILVGTNSNGKGVRMRWGVPLENGPLIRSDAFESWLNLFIDNKERLKLDQKWLEASMATLDPWKRVRSMSRGFPELLEMSASEQDAYLKQQTQDHLKSYEAYSYRPTVPPNHRYQAYLELCHQLDALVEPNMVHDLLKFAESAWRRPLTENEQQRVRELYQSSRIDMDVQDAGRHVVASILASPHFIFRPEISGSNQPTHPVPPAGLANRLSYLLWSSAPDDSLRELIYGQQEVSGEMLFQEFQRMKKDQKVERFALEFFGVWFGFKDFGSGHYQRVDAQRFPEFDKKIRLMMFRQSTDFFLDLIQQDRPVTDIILGNEIPYNPRLALYSNLDYQQVKWLPDEKGNMPKLPKAEDLRDDPKLKKLKDQSLYRADISSVLESRGVWAHGSILKLTSKRVRTDPIRRGLWFYETLLGHHLPPPPENVGMLPEDDKQDDGLTLRQRLEKHRTQAGCAACHAKFDPFGLALEEFDAIGRYRQKSTTGLTLDTSFKLGEIKGSGAAAIRKYLEQHQEEFLRHFSRRLIAYALGREALPSDQALIDRMIENGKQHEHRFSSYVRTLLESRQFQYRRGMPIAVSK